MSQVTEQSVRFQTALASIKLIQASAVLDLTEDDFDFLTSKDRKSGSAGMPRPISYAVFCLKKKKKRRVLFLGNELAERIFGKRVDPIGKSVVVEGLPLTVVGVLKKKFQDSSNNGPDADRGVIPYSKFRTIYGNRFVNHLIVQPRDASRGPLVKAELYRVLGRKYRFDPTDERALGMWDFIESEKESLAVGLGIQI